MIDAIKQLDLAMQVLTTVFQATKASEIGDALDILSAWHEQYIEDNSQHRVGA